MGGPRGSSDIHAQHTTFLLRVDEKWSSWLLSLKYTFETLFPLGLRVQQIFAEIFMFII